MRIWADVYNASDVLQGPGPVDTVISAAVARVLDGPGDVKLTLPVVSDRVQDLIANERRVKVKVWHEGPETERDLGYGVLRVISGAVESSPGTLQVSGPDQLQLLARLNLWLGWEREHVLLATVITALETAASGWTFTQVDVPRVYVTARLDGVSVLKALQELCARYGIHFRLDGDKTIKIGVLEDDAELWITSADLAPADMAAVDSVAIIKRVAWQRSTEAVVNTVVPLGGGQGEAALTLQHSTRGADYYDPVEVYNTGRDGYERLRASAVPVKDKLAQSFQLDGDQWVTAVRLQLRAKGSPAGTMTLRIETDSGGSPSGTLVHASATATFDEADLALTWTWERFVLAGQFYLDGSTTYWIVLSTDRAVSSVNNVRWASDGSSPAYANGVSKYESSSVWTAPGKDCMFEVETTIDSRTSSTLAEHGFENRSAVATLKRSGMLGPADLSGAVLTASNEKTGAPAEEAVDGILDGNYAWKTNDGVNTGTLEIDNSPTAIDVLGYRLRTSIKDWALEYDDSGWVEKDSETDLEYNYAIWQYEKVFAGTESRAKWRLNVTEGNGSNVSVIELELLVSGNNAKLAQSFTTDATAVRVKQIELWLKKHGLPTGNLTVSIQGDSGGSPDGTPVAVGDGTSNTVAASTLTTGPQKITFTFDNPPQLAASTTYWLVLETTDSAHATNFVEWYVDSDAGFAGGTFKRYFDSWWSETGHDAIFKVVAEAEEHPYVIQNTTENGQTIYYLADATSVAAYGAIEAVLKVNVSPVGHNALDIARAADAVYDAAAAYLERHAVRQDTYTLALTKAHKTLKPGQRVRVVYEGAVDDRDGNTIAWLSLNDRYWITKVTETVSGEGGTMTVEVSTVDRAPRDVVDELIEMVERVQLAATFVEPYPAVFTYSIHDMACADHIRARNSVNVSVGKQATAVLTPNPAIIRIVRVLVRVKTAPMYTPIFLDGINQAAEANVVGTYAVIDDDRYPADIDIFIDGVNKSAVLTEENEGTTGPWLTDTDQNEEWDALFDITEQVLVGDAANITQDVEVAFGLGTRNTASGVTIKIPSYAGYGYAANAEPSMGVFRITLEVHAITQAVKTS